MVELPFLDQASQSLDRLLYWNIIVHARALKKVQLLRSTKGRIDVVDTTTQVLWRRVWLEPVDTALPFQHCC